MLRKRAIRLNEKRAIKLKEIELSNSYKKESSRIIGLPSFCLLSTIKDLHLIL